MRAVGACGPSRLRLLLVRSVERHERAYHRALEVGILARHSLLRGGGVLRIRRSSLVMTKVLSAVRHVKNQWWIRA